MTEANPFNQTIGEVARQFSVSARTLRYYEQIGLLTGDRDWSGYRSYDQDAIDRLGAIVRLRTLRIPLRQVQELLSGITPDAASALLTRHLTELDAESDTLAEVCAQLRALIDLIGADGSLTDVLTGDLPASPPSPHPHTIQEDSMPTPTLTDVRVVYLPPATVASVHVVGPDPEERCGQALDRFVLDNDLAARKPDLRHYGFNHPGPDGRHGYEMWVTIPDDLDVPAPLTKQTFAGGRYAAHAITMGNFEEWAWLAAWVRYNDRFEAVADPSMVDRMGGCLEEHLDYLSHLSPDGSEPEGMQLDLLIPVRER